MATNGFGDYFKELRINRGFTLRQFCEKHGFDPGNISKLERGIFPAPESPEKLEEYAKALGLRKGSDEWLRFFDLAVISNKDLGLLHLRNEQLIEKLPVLFRTLDNKELTEEKLDAILELIRKA
jgi:transcriptional regulator with XRE-family HTH domain